MYEQCFPKERFKAITYLANMTYNDKSWSFSLDFINIFPGVALSQQSFRMRKAVAYPPLFLFPHHTWVSICHIASYCFKYRGNCVYIWPYYTLIFLFEASVSGYFTCFVSQATPSVSIKVLNHWTSVWCGHCSRAHGEVLLLIIHSLFQLQVRVEWALLFFYSLSSTYLFLERSIKLYNTRLEIEEV